MPRKNGWEVLEAVKSTPKTSSVPVIVLTGINDDDDMLKCYESGAEYYISKPFTPSQLLYGVRMMFGEGENCWKA
jgi:CheY-like chemotaxis protein